MDKREAVKNSLPKYRRDTAGVFICSSKDFRILVIYGKVLCALDMQEKKTILFLGWMQQIGLVIDFFERETDMTWQPIAKAMGEKALASIQYDASGNLLD